MIRRQLIAFSHVMAAFPAVTTLLWQLHVIWRNCVELAHDLAVLGVELVLADGSWTWFFGITIIEFEFSCGILDKRPAGWMFFAEITWRSVSVALAQSHTIEMPV